MLKIRRQRLEKAQFDGLAKAIIQNPASLPISASEARAVVELPQLKEVNQLYKYSKNVIDVVKAVLEKTFNWQEKTYTARYGLEVGQIWDSYPNNREILSKCHVKHIPKSHLDKSYEADIKGFLKSQYPNKNEESEALSRNYILTQGGVMLASKVDVDDYVISFPRKK